jgi:hypothetical protein
VQVSYDEGVANHIGPESCAVVREGLGEALTGVRVGQPLSRESFQFWVRRRSQKDRFSWQRMHRLAADWIPKSRILHPYPDKRFAVTHPRLEPCAGIPPARIWAGGGQ